MQHQLISRRSFIGLAAGSAVMAALGLSSCSNPNSNNTPSDSPTSNNKESKALTGSITAVGSTALQPLCEAAAEAFMNKQPGVQITVQGGGSGTGITQIVQGAVQIGNSDVFAEAKVKDQADLSKVTDNRVCVVGMGPVVHPQVGVTDISLDDLARIFTGEVSNWNELGGSDTPIVVINRQSGSGTRAVFESAVLQGRESGSFQEQDSSGTVAKMVAETPGAISYLAFSYFSEKTVPLSVNGIAPKPEHVETNEWTIWAYEHMYTSTNPDEATQAFIDFMLSDEVQGELVQSNGYIPVSGMKVQKDAAGNVSQI